MFLLADLALVRCARDAILAQVTLAGLVMLFKLTLVNVRDMPSHLPIDYTLNQI